MAKISKAYGLTRPIQDNMPIPIRMNRRPLTTDKNFSLGQLWLYYVGEEIWGLVDIVANQAIWVLVGGGGGVVIQQVRASTSDLISCPVVIPEDDTIPQNDEGTEVLTVSITPTRTDSVLLIEFSTWMGGGNNSIMALFQDDTADALAAAEGAISTSGGTLRHFMTSGTTSETTFKIRIGPGVGDFDVNGDSIGRKFGGVSSTVLTVTEYQN